MFFRWLKQRRRRTLLAQPFPEPWRAALAHNVPLYARLASPQQEQVHNYLRVFIPEKNWEGCGGFTITPEVQATIAAQVAILVLGFREEYFDRVRSILIYPDAYVARDTSPTRGGGVLEGPSAREGEAWYRGPVILSWSDVLTDDREENDGRNLVLHEFAHQLDMLSGGVADGVPPLETAEQLARWNSVLESEFQQLVHDYNHSRRPLLDSYAGTSPAEFFAVATEMFFERPLTLKRRLPALYGVLSDFYRQEPAIPLET